LQKREISEKKAIRFPIRLGLICVILHENLLEEISMRTCTTLAAMLFCILSATHIGEAQSRKRTGFTEWSAPVNIGPPINSQWDDSVPMLSKDEKSLFFTSTRPDGFGGEDIWVAKRQNRNAPWQEPVNLGSGVNTEHTDRLRSLSSDGRIILFESDRPGGYGGNDIWAIVRKNTNDDFDWSRPVNLGSVINTPYNEVGAKYLFNERHPNGDLFFSSGRPGGLGGPDIYESAVTANGFAAPVNVFELNTDSIESCFWVRDDGLEIIFTSNRPDVTRDINKFDLYVSTRSSLYESWSPPANLGPTINSDGYIEANPMLASNDTVLYFASARPNANGSAGNLDIYMSTRKRLDR
jgi:hypothetical protein